METLNNDMVDVEVEIPRWLYVAALEQNIDFSAILIEGLKKYLGIVEPNSH